MKKLLLMGAIFLGSLSFVAGDVDCFDTVNKVLSWYRKFNFDEETKLAIWEHTFYKCHEENGQLLDEVVVTIAEN